jgi:hypothetical protein
MNDEADDTLCVGGLRFDRSPEGPPHRRISDQSTIGMRFNVMPGRTVEETFYVREYRIWPRYIEAEFDRSYLSEMKNSPSHVVFLTALVHTQKLMYLYMCHEVGIEYSPTAEEQLKLWPTKVNVRMPKMIVEERGITHRLHVTRLRRLGEKTYKMFIRSRVENIVSIDVDVPIFLL